MSKDMVTYWLGQIAENAGRADGVALAMKSIRRVTPETKDKIINTLQKSAEQICIAVQKLIYEVFQEDKDAEDSQNMDG